MYSYLLGNPFGMSHIHFKINVVKLFLSPMEHFCSVLANGTNILSNPGENLGNPFGFFGLSHP